jgi:hypothetical protein
MLNSKNTLKPLLKTILKTEKISLKKLFIALVMQPLATTIIIIIIIW